MPYTPKYTNVGEIENYLLTTIADTFKAQVETWIGVVETFIDKYTGRNFKADTSATTKKYEVEGLAESFGTKIRKNLFIDDCVEITELKIDDELVDPTDYLIYPANELPKTRIVLDDDSGFSFKVGQQNIEVKAKWGYSVSPPNDIVFVATILASGIINYGKGLSSVRSEAIGNYSVTYGDEVSWQDFKRAMDILDSYKKLNI